MPCPIVGGLIEYMVPLLAEAKDLTSYSVWDGTTPRFDTNGNAVAPSSTTGSWPVVNLDMDESGFAIGNTFNDNRDEEGWITVDIWGTTREQVENMIAVVDNIFAPQPTLQDPQNVVLGQGQANDPNYVIKMLLKSWTCFNDPNLRTATSQWLYHGIMRYSTSVHTSANYVAGL